MLLDRLHLKKNYILRQNNFESQLTTMSKKEQIQNYCIHK